MGQKVSPHGLRVGVIKDWNLNGMQIKRALLISSQRTTRSENSSRRSCT